MVKQVFGHQHHVRGVPAIDGLDSGSARGSTEWFEGSHQKCCHYGLCRVYAARK